MPGCQVGSAFGHSISLLQTSYGLQAPCLTSWPRYHDLAFEYIWPLLKADVRRCVEQNASEALVVHLRGQDLWNMGEFEQVEAKSMLKAC